MDLVGKIVGLVIIVILVFIIYICTIHDGDN